MISRLTKSENEKKNGILSSKQLDFLKKYDFLSLNDLDNSINMLENKIDLMKNENLEYDISGEEFNSDYLNNLLEISGLLKKSSLVLRTTNAEGQQFTLNLVKLSDNVNMIIKQYISIFIECHIESIKKGIEIIA